jgi:cyclopropane fatty-acyl-phospholipid synthase-like methyltransferase
MVSFGKAFEDWLRTYLAARSYRKSFRNLRLQGTERVFELGCGGGQAARVVLSRLTGGGTYTGIDVDEWWLDRAKRNLRAYPNAELLLGDVRR